MRKRIAAALVLCILMLAPAAAGEIEFVLDAFDTNGDFALGFLPTFLTIGGDYTGFEFLDGQSTDLMFIAGGGWTQRQIWNDAADDYAAITDDDVRKFNVITGEWKLILEQGLFWSDATFDDLFTFHAGYLGRYESYMENKDSEAVSYFFTASDDIVPEGEALVSNTLEFGASVDTVETDMVTFTGFDAELSVSYAPEWMLNSLLDSTVDYYSVYAVATGYLPLYEQRGDDYMNDLSVYLADRVRLDHINGSAVPVYAQKESSLGYKMRGFESYSYPMSFSVVNNFDVRVSGPEVLIPGLFPRGGIYIDAGYYAGHYPNDKDAADDGVLLSAGAELAFSFFDFLNLGLRGNYVMLGDTLTGSDFSYNIFMTMQY